jgi:diadenosine tetraphosphate (Ap4A) HIT family hydrolase
MNPTIEKFGYPDTLIKEYGHWVVLLRPVQVTVGSLVLACKEDAQSFGTISPEASTELQSVVADLEGALAAAFSYQRINYLALMMVDKEVHFHVLPRYEKPVALNQNSFEDLAWPGAPDIMFALSLSAEDMASIKQIIESAWPH